MAEIDYDKAYYTRPQAQAYINNPKIWLNLTDMIQSFKPEKIFEFGSGLGQVLFEASKRGLNIIGSETSEYALTHNLAPQKIIKIGLIPKNKLPFPDCSFDLVFSTEVLEHIPAEEVEPVISELYRVCNRHALLTINTFDHVWRPKKRQPGHITIKPHKWWVEHFTNCGFSENKNIEKKMKKMRYLKWDIFVFDKRLSS